MSARLWGEHGAFAVALALCQDAPADATNLGSRAASERSFGMSITIEAVYEDGVLKPFQALPLAEHEKVQVTVHTAVSRVRASAGLIPCNDPAVIERVALEPVEEL